MPRRAATAGCREGPDRARAAALGLTAGDAAAKRAAEMEEGCSLPAKGQGEAQGCTVPADGPTNVPVHTHLILENFGKTSAVRQLGHC